MPDGDTHRRLVPALGPDAVGEQLGTLGFNALYGNGLCRVPVEEQDVMAAHRLAAAHAAATIGAVVLDEPLSGAPDYLLRTAADVQAVRRRASAGDPAALDVADLLLSRAVRTS